MTISISNIPSSAQISVAFSPVISFSGAVSGGTVQIQDLTTGYDSGAVAYSGTSGTVPMTITGSGGAHSLRLTFSGDGVTNFSVIAYNTLLTTTVAVDPVLLYIASPISTIIQPVTTNNGDGSPVFSISPSLQTGLSFSASTGQISGTPTGILANTIYTVQVVDSSSQVSNKTFTMNIAYRVPETANVSASVAYGSSANTIALSIQYTYTSVAVVAAPTHGSTSIVGTAIKYTPTSGWNGTDSFTYSATNPAGVSNISTVSITVTSVGVTVKSTIASGALPRGITTSPINPITFNATGGKTPYTVSLSSGQLPSGLQLLSNIISGTPTTVGTFNFNLTTADSSSPTAFTTSTNYVMNVLSLDDVNKIITSEKSSKYSKTSDEWNKTPLTVTPQDNWQQWGLFRSYIGSPSIGWGSDSIQETSGTVDIPYSGSNVDVVVIALGSANPKHPEFAVNPDGTGGSRVKYYDWLDGTGTKYSDREYRNYEANAAAAVTSIIAGNTYGWARNANIYTLDLSLMPGYTNSTVGGFFGLINGIFDYPDLAAEMVVAFEAVAKFHANKLPNPVTGLPNPTIVICNQILSYNAFTPPDVDSITFKGSTNSSAPFTTATLATYYIDSPFTDLSTTTSYQKNIKLNFNDPTVTTAVEKCTILPGLVFVGPAGDYKGYTDILGGADYNNTTAVSSPNTAGTFYYCRGASPSNAGITVGAGDSTSVEKVARYSSVGPGVDLFAPGSDLMVAFNSTKGVANLYYEDIAPTVPDPRNELYSIGKVSGTAYAAAQVAGFLACLAQVKPTITQESALSYLQSNAGLNQLSTGTVTTGTIAGTSVGLYSVTSNSVTGFFGASVPAYGTFLNTYGVWTNSDLASPGDTPVTVNLFFTAPVAASTYILQVSADNELKVYLNGSATASITSINSYRGSESTTVTLTKGVNRLQCVVRNYGQPNTVFNPAGFGIVVQDAYGNHIFETSPSLPIATYNSAPTNINNLYLFGAFPKVDERVISVPAVATNQPFSINVSGGVSNSAFYFSGDTEVSVATYNFSTGTVSTEFSGNFTVTNQVFTTPGIKTYDFYFANTTDRVTLSVEVIAHDATTILSSYTQTSDLWNKTHDYIPPENDWLNWGLLRSSTSTNVFNWGSDSVKVDSNGTISVPYAGLNVDIVIIDSGSIDPAHPEFALYSDGTGLSRVKYYDWTGSIYPVPSYYTSSDDNRATAVAGIAAGNTYGWARAANIYSLNYTVLSGTTKEASAFDLVKNFHNAKTVDPVTGYKKPTVIIAGWAKTFNTGTTYISSVNYRGTSYAGPIAQTTLNQYGILAPYTNISDTTTYSNLRDSTLDTAVTAAIAAGIVVVSTPGDTSAYCAKDSSDSNWNNYFVSGGTSYYYHRGASPGAVSGVICVGALDSEVGQHKAPYSGNGPRVNIFAPGSDQITAMSNFGGIRNPRLTAFTPTVSDSRNSSYYVGKDSGTAYAAANVAGYLAGLLQVYPTLTSPAAINTVTQYAVSNQLTINLQGYGVNRDLNGANNLTLYTAFPNYNENIATQVNNSTVTSIALGEYFDIVITNGSPYSYFTWSGSDKGRGQLDANGNGIINTFAKINTGAYTYRFYFPLTNHTVTLQFKVLASPDVTTGKIIYASDFDRVQNRVKYLVKELYGITPSSSLVTTSTVATTSSWTNLYKDIEYAYMHQNNDVLESLAINTSTRLTAQEINLFSDTVDVLIDNFDNVDPTQIVVANTLTITTSTTDVYDLYSRTYHWTTSTEFPNTARTFFNLGGYVEVNFQNPSLGNQKGQFTLTNYINGSGSITLPIPGGNVISKLSVQGINGNTATVTTVVAPDLGSSAIATGTVKLYVSTSATGGIAGQVPTVGLTDDRFTQGQLTISPINQFITITGTNVTTYSLTVQNTSPNAITVSKISVIDDTSSPPLDTKIKTSVPFTVAANTYTNLSISFQNVTPGGVASLHNNSIQLISDGPNEVLNFAIPIVTKFGIEVDSLDLVVTKATTATLIPIPYAGTMTSYTARLTGSATGFQILNPGINYTYFTLDDTPGKLTMGLLLANELFKGLSAPSTTGALKSPFSEPVLIIDVASIPNKTTSTQITYTAYNGSNVGTYTTTVSVTPEVTDKHLGDWISPKNFPNGVIGFSYDIINGDRYLTYGFGMGGGGSGQIYALDTYLEPSGDSLYYSGMYSDYSMPQLGLKFQSAITTSTAFSGLGGWNTGTAITTSTNWNTTTQTLNYPVSKLVELSTGTNNNPFLQTYGVWSGADSSSTTCISSGTFLARDQGEYTYYLNIDARLKGNTAETTATVTIDGIEIATTNTNSILSGSVVLSPGLHKIIVSGVVKPSTLSEIVLINGAQAFAITDYTDYVVWSTLVPMPPTWAEIGRIKLVDDDNPRSYQIPTNVYSANIAGETSYSTYFENNSIVTVNDNGYGQLSISLNSVTAAANDDKTNATLVNVPYLFYYASAAENQSTSNKRYNNYQTVGQYVKYFTGFDPYGKVTTKNVLGPGYIAPPTVILAKYQQLGGGDDKKWWEEFFTFVAEVAVLGAVVIVGLYLLALAGFYPIVGAYTAVAFGWSAFFTFAGEVLVAIFCFTEDTEVTMADGSVKKIKDIQVGDYVFNHDKTSINKVKYVEATVNRELTGLYSPDENIAPFATLNHPLYVNGKLSSLAPEPIYKMYPWLGMTSQITPERTGPLHPGELMYNLYLDGDNTFIVNGYGTNSIIGDGGALRIMIEQGYFTQDRVQEMFNEYIDEGTEVAFGGYLFNKYLGKVLEVIKFKFVSKMVAESFGQPKDSKFRKMANKVFKFIGTRAIKHQQKALKK